jgi:hypothetical protein
MSVKCNKSLLEQLPKIVADGKREAEQILERLEGSARIGLQTREMVVPSRDTNWRDFLVDAERGNADLTLARKLTEEALELIRQEEEK